MTLAALQILGSLLAWTGSYLTGNHSPTDRYRGFACYLIANALLALWLALTLGTQALPAICLYAAFTITAARGLANNRRS